MSWNELQADPDGVPLSSAPKTLALETDAQAAFVAEVDLFYHSAPSILPYWSLKSKHAFRSLPDYTSSIIGAFVCVDRKRSRYPIIIGVTWTFRSQGPRNHEPASIVRHITYTHEWRNKGSRGTLRIQPSRSIAHIPSRVDKVGLVFFFRTRVWVFRNNVLSETQYPSFAPPFARTPTQLCHFFFCLVPGFCFGLDTRGRRGW